MAKTTYYGYWSTGSSYNMPGYEFTNLSEAKKIMRKIAKGNNAGSGCRWWILDNLEPESYEGEHTVASGDVR